MHGGKHRHCGFGIALFFLVTFGVVTLPQPASAEIDFESFDAPCFANDEFNNNVLCNDPTATGCRHDEDPWLIDLCASVGFTSVVDGWKSCVDPTCTATIASVPEFEDYAAMLFMSLALLTGWQIRRRALVPA